MSYRPRQNQNLKATSDIDNCENSIVINALRIFIFNQNSFRYKLTHGHISTVSDSLLKFNNCNTVNISWRWKSVLSIFSGLEKHSWQYPKSDRTIAQKESIWVVGDSIEVILIKYRLTYTKIYWFSLRSIITIFRQSVQSVYSSNVIDRKNISVISVKSFSIVRAILSILFWRLFRKMKLIQSQVADITLSKLISCILCIFLNSTWYRLIDRK